MKIIQRKRGTGKTTRCFKRALRLLKEMQNIRGYVQRDVIYLNPCSMERARMQLHGFVRYLEGTRFGKKVNIKVSKNHLWIICGRARIMFMSYDYYTKYRNECYVGRSKVIFDDIDDLFPNEMLDTISVSKWR